MTTRKFYAGRFAPGFYKTKKTSIMDVFVTGVTGFEPVFTVLETVALPLNYTPLCLSAFATDFYIVAYDRRFVNTFFEKIPKIDSISVP